MPSFEQTIHRYLSNNTTTLKTTLLDKLPVKRPPWCIQDSQSQQSIFSGILGISTLKAGQSEWSLMMQSPEIQNSLCIRIVQISNF